MNVEDVNEGKRLIEALKHGAQQYAAKDDSRPNVLAYLSALQSAAEDLDDLIGHVVAEARLEGHSWEAVGGYLGVSRQSAWERYRRVEKTT